MYTGYNFLGVIRKKDAGFFNELPVATAAQSVSLQLVLSMIVEDDGQWLPLFTMSCPFAIFGGQLTYMT